MDNLISVIVPVYNAGRYFDRCIESIVCQTYTNIQIIIVNDGSTDGTAEKCDAWAKRDNRIKVIHKENGGASSARNVGLDNAIGNYIAFVDADDYIDAEMYEIMLREIIENNADAARCGVERVSDDGKIEDWGSGNYDIRIVDKASLLKDIGEAFGILPVTSSNKLFKREVIGDIRFNESFNFAEDTLFNFMVAKNINKMIYHDVNRYHYTFNSSSITSNNINENNFDEHRVMDLIFTIADDETMPYCIKGDVLKSFRTIRQMILSNKYMRKNVDGCEQRFPQMRKRIVSHLGEILKSPLYSRLTKLRTLLLWISPPLYKFLIKYVRKH